MARVESKFQKSLMDKIRDEYPGCIILKNDDGYIQGIPDWTIFYEDKYVVLEAKRSEHESHQPNQDYYINEFDKMSYSSFVYPENEEQVLSDIRKVFSRKKRRHI